MSERNPQNHSEKPPIFNGDFDPLQFKRILEQRFEQTETFFGIELNAFEMLKKVTQVAARKINLEPPTYSPRYWEQKYPVVKYHPDQEDEHMIQVGMRTYQDGIDPVLAVRPLDPRAPIKRFHRQHSRIAQVAVHQGRMLHMPRSDMSLINILLADEDHPELVALLQDQQEYVTWVERAAEAVDIHPVHIGFMPPAQSMPSPN